MGVIVGNLFIIVHQLLADIVIGVTVGMDNQCLGLLGLEVGELARYS